MILFIIPHAGSSVLAYSNFKKIIEKKYESIEVVTIELPGRGRKSSAPFQKDVNGVCNCIMDEIKNKIISSDDEYVFYGHSMGGLIAYEVVSKIMMDSYIIKKPLKLIVSSRRSPLCPEKDYFYKLPEKEFIEVVKSYGFSTTVEVFEDPAICRYFLSIMRSDFEIVEGYRCEAKSFPKVDITVFWGEKDRSLSEELIEAWNKATEGSVRIIRKNGGHFFNFDNPEGFSDELIGEIFR